MNRAQKRRLLVVAVCFAVAIVIIIGTALATSAPTQAPAHAVAATHTVQSTKAPTHAVAKPTDKPSPTKAPTPKPVATVSPAQLEAVYKLSTTDTTIASINRDGAQDNGSEQHFTGTITAFVKDRSGTTAGVNMTDATGADVQVILPAGVDLSQLNTSDTLQVWGTNNGVSSGQNAFGAQVQEVVVDANYLSDSTTGYNS